MIWVMYLIYRYHYPVLILEALLFFIAGLLSNKFTFFIGGIIAMQIFYFSIAFHEACHMSFAKIFKVNTESISYKPYTVAGIRTNFSRERIIASDDLFAIIFAGPFIPIFLGMVALIVCLSLKTYIDASVFVFLGMFEYINLLSLLPLNGTDGRRVYAYIKKKPSYIKILIASMAFYFYTVSGLKRIFK
jgi:hypothetical protein